MRFNQKAFGGELSDIDREALNDPTQFGGFEQKLAKISKPDTFESR